MSSTTADRSSGTSLWGRRGDEGGGGGGEEQHRGLSHNGKNRSRQGHRDNRRRRFGKGDRREGERGGGGDKSFRRVRKGFDLTQDREGKINSSASRQRRHLNVRTSPASSSTVWRGSHGRREMPLHEKNVVGRPNGYREKRKEREKKERIVPFPSRPSAAATVGVEAEEAISDEDARRTCARQNTGPALSTTSGKKQQTAASMQPHSSSRQSMLPFSPSSAARPLPSLSFNACTSQTETPASSSSSSSSVSSRSPYSSSSLDQAVVSCNCLDWLSLWDQMPWYVALKKVESSVLVLPPPAPSSSHPPPLSSPSSPVLDAATTQEEEERVLFYFYKMGERLLLKLSEDYRSLISQDSEQRWLLQLTDFPSSSFPNSRPPPPHHRNQDRRRGRGKPFPDKKSSAFHGDGEVDGPPTDGFGSFFSSQKKGGREEGTRGDVLSALSLLIQQQPLCALALLHRLLNLIGKKRRGAQMLGRKKKMGRGATTTGGRSHAALEVAFDLFQGHLILPAFRKLRLIQDQPAWLRSKVVELLLSFEDRHTGSGDARGGGEREGENKRRGGEEEAEEGKGEDLEEKKMKDGGEAKDTKMKGGRGRGKGGDNEGQKRSQAMVIPLLQLSMLWRLEVELKMIYAAFVDHLADGISDSVLHFSSRSLRFVSSLLMRKKEQEQRLLSLLVQALGSAQTQISSLACRLLAMLLRRHSPMKLVVVKYVGSFILQEISSSLHQAAHTALLTWNKTRKHGKEKKALARRKLMKRQRRDLSGAEGGRGGEEGKDGQEEIASDGDRKDGITQGGGRSKRVEAIQRLLRKLGRGRGGSGGRGSSGLLQGRSGETGEGVRRRGGGGGEQQQRQLQGGDGGGRAFSSSSSSSPRISSSEVKEILLQVFELLIPPKFSDALQPVYRGIHFLAELQFNKQTDAEVAMQTVRVYMQVFTSLHQFPSLLHSLFLRSKNPPPGAETPPSSNTLPPLPSPSSSPPFSNKLKKTPWFPKFPPLYTLSALSRLVRALLTGLHRVFPYLSPETASATASVSMQSPRSPPSSSSSPGRGGDQAGRGGEQEEEQQQEQLVQTLYSLSHTLPAPASRIVVLRLLHKIVCTNNYSTTDRLTRVVYEHLQSPDVFGASNRAALFSLVHSLVLPPAPPFLSSSSSSLHDPAHPSEEGDPAEFSASSFPSQAPSSFASSASSFVSYQSLTDITRSTALCKRLLQGSLCQIEQPGVAAAAVQVCGRFVRASLEVGRDPVSRKPPSKHREILEESNSQKSLISRLLKDSERELQESDEEESFHDLEDDEEDQESLRRQGARGREGQGGGESSASSSSLCVYDPVKRDPRYSRASESRLWELFAATTFYHPAVSSVASATIDVVGKSMTTSAQSEKSTRQKKKKEAKQDSATKGLLDQETAAGLASSLTHSRVLDLLAYKPSAIFDGGGGGTRSQRERKRKKVGEEKTGGEGEGETKNLLPLDSAKRWAIPQEKIAPQEQFMANYFQDPFVVESERMRRLKRKVREDEEDSDEGEGGNYGGLVDQDGEEEEEEEQLLSDEEIDAFLSKQLAAQFGVDAAEEEDDEDADLHALDEDDDIEEEGEEEEEEEEGGDGEREEEWGDDLSSGDEDLEDFADDENEEDEEDDEEEEEEVDDRDSSGASSKCAKALKKIKRKERKGGLQAQDKAHAERLQRLREHVRNEKKRNFGSSLAGGGSFVSAEGIEDLLRG